MTKQPEWADVLRSIEAFCIDQVRISTVLDVWLSDDSTGLDHVDMVLSGAMLGAAELDGPNGRQCLLAVSARINELSHALGDTYWQTLAKAPPKIAVSKAGTHRIRDVRHQVILIDVTAWRA